jgi:hypothetical protein
MRELAIGNKTIRVKATPLALLFYKQEFKTDLVGDLLKMQELEHDPSKFDSVVVLQIIWAMAKADAGISNKFPSFLAWVADLDSFDMSDSEILQAVMEEAVDGFFRRGKSRQ